MNDFERKLSQQPFRLPPPDLRKALFGSLPQVVTPPAWTWRQWFWPSPQAWGALAALWLLFAAVSMTTQDSTPPKNTVALPPAAPVTLLTFHQTHRSHHVIEFPN